MLLSLFLPFLGREEKISLPSYPRRGGERNKSSSLSFFFLDKENKRERERSEKNLIELF